MTNEEFVILKERVEKGKEIDRRIQLLRDRIDAAERTEKVVLWDKPGNHILTLTDCTDIIREAIIKAAKTEIAFLETEFAQL